MSRLRWLERRYLALDFSFPWRTAAAMRTLIYVDVSHQKLYLYKGRRLLAVYPVSTAANGTGCVLNSGCTPTGWHSIVKKIGSGSAVGTIFSARVPGSVAKSLSDHSSQDLITSRILWLSGLERGHNLGGSVDSCQRYIYIHGTAQEHLIGRQVSHGCVRMLNRDVIQLHDWVDEGTPVLIEE